MAELVAQNVSLKSESGFTCGRRAHSSHNQALKPFPTTSFILISCIPGVYNRKNLIDMHSKYVLVNEEGRDQLGVVPDHD